MRNPGWLARALVVFAAAALCGAWQTPAPPPPTSLPLLLTGIMADSADSARSACLVRCLRPVERRSASLLHAGERACDLADITQIRPDLVVVRNLQTGRLESLTLPDAAGAKAPRPASEDAPQDPVVVDSREPGVVNIDVSKAAVDHYLVNLTHLLASAQAVPRVRAAPGGRQVIDGFELRQVRAGSVIEKVGLKDGDLLVQVNGEPLDGLPAVLRLFSQAQATGQARLTVLRGGERLTFVLKTR
jgi:type II secretory pathway component PulC